MFLEFSYPKVFDDIPETRDQSVFRSLALVDYNS